MSDKAEKHCVPSEDSSSSESESDEDPYASFESEDLNPRNIFSDSTYDPFLQRTTQIIFEYQSGRRITRLREPRDLYGVSSTSFLHLPRWPYECEVLKERVEHIEWDPPSPEPIYKPTGLEKEPVNGESLESKIVYLVNEGSKETYFMCSRVGGNRRPLKQVTPQCCEKTDNTLVFEARFESGNLQKAVQVDNYEYELTLRTDLYTQRHTQWYYFRVKNTRTGVPYRFTIINFIKPTSLYSHGMQPLMYSEMKANTSNIGWQRIGEEITYYKNNYGQNGQQYYSLSWTFTFPHNDDTCYFAHCYPYTYSNLQDYLLEIANDPERSIYCKIRVLCHSLAGKMVYILTITNPSSSNKEPKKKKAVIVTARVHPGETNSSWVMKGFLDYILSSRSDAILLRNTFIFKVVPMLNPDGVIVGNYRCSLSGRDLNRNYKSRLKDSFPTVWFTRNMIKRVMEEREILLYCDLHGHSRKQNVFMYGCKGKGAQAEDSHLFERIFPLTFSKNCPEKFSFSDCKFKVQRNKEGTGRVVMWKMGIRNSYTLEATFCGSTLGKRRGTHFSTKDLESLGYHFCDSLLDYCDPDQTKYYLCLKELSDMLKQRAISKREKLLYLEDATSDLDSSTGGSDSSDSNGPPAHLMALASRVKPRKKLLKTKKERNYHRKQKEAVITQEPLDESKALAGKETVFITEQETSLRSLQQSTMENQPNLQKAPAMSRSHISKLQKDSHLQGSNTKKLSLIYLTFNSKGDVITTKSQSYLRNENMMEITSSLSRFHWNKPLPLFKSLLSQGFHLSNMLQQSPYNALICNEYASGSTIPYGESDQESGDQKTLGTPVSSLLQNPSRCKQSLWGRGIQMDRNPSVLDDPSLFALLHRGSGSPPSYTARATELQKANRRGQSHVWVKGHQEVGASLTDKGSHFYSTGPLSRTGSNKDLEDYSTQQHGKEELCLPAVTSTKKATLKGIRLHNVMHPNAAIQNLSTKSTLPKVVAPTGMAKVSKASSLLPSKGLKGKSVMQSRNGLLPKRELGNLQCPSSKLVKECQEPKVSLGTWKDILLGVDADDAQRPADLGLPQSEYQPVTDTESRHDTVKLRTVRSTSLKARERHHLVPLGNSSQNSKEFQLFLNQN